MKRKRLITTLLTLGVCTLAITQIGQILKIGGIALLIDKFGPDLNKAMNGLTKHKDSGRVKTKVVTILSVGIGRSSAIGAAQVMGPPEKVDQVVAIAQPEGEFLGKEIRLRALIPVSDKNVGKGIKTVDGVGVSGIVDIRL